MRLSIINFSFSLFTLSKLRLEGIDGWIHYFEPWICCCSPFADWHVWVECVCVCVLAAGWIGLVLVLVHTHTIEKATYCPNLIIKRSGGAVLWCVYICRYCLTLPPSSPSSSSLSSPEFGMICRCAVAASEIGANVASVRWLGLLPLTLTRVTSTGRQQTGPWGTLWRLTDWLRNRSAELTVNFLFFILFLGYPIDWVPPLLLPTETCSTLGFRVRVHVKLC